MNGYSTSHTLKKGVLSFRHFRESGSAKGGSEEVVHHSFIIYYVSR